MTSNTTYEGLLNTFSSYEAYQLDILPALDNHLWQKAETQHTKQAYTNYLNLLPKGTHQHEANQRIDHLERTEKNFQFIIAWAKNNNLTEQMPEDVNELSKLSALDLRSCKLTKLPPEICELTNLKTLDLRFNKLTILPPEIGNLTNLRSLILEENQLTALPPKICNLTKLIWLGLEGNQLTALPPVMEWSPQPQRGIIVPSVK